MVGHNFSQTHYSLIVTKNNQLNALLNLYAACRMAADKEARKMSQEDIVNEVEYFDLTDPNSEFYKVITKLLGSSDAKNV